MNKSLTNNSSVVGNTTFSCIAQKAKELVNGTNSIKFDSANNSVYLNGTRINDQKVFNTLHYLYNMQYLLLKDKQKEGISLAKNNGQYKGRKEAYSAANQAIIVTYWNIGRRIVEEEQSGNARADYGKQLINQLADKLSIEYGNNYTARRLRDYRQFYLCFRDLQIWHSRVPNLTWTHFRRIMAVPQE